VVVAFSAEIVETNMRPTPAAASGRLPFKPE
jgi:hypothetical protein